MIVYGLTFLFYTTGTVLALHQNGSELSLWFLAFGIALDLAMIYFDWVGAKFAPRLGEGDFAAKVLRLGAFFMWFIAFFLRILPQIPAFKTLIGIAFALWIAFFIKSLISHYRKPRPQ